MTFTTLPASVRARGVTAVLGPTNTGKTHLAIERLVAHESGMIGLPLRLLAREVYQRVVERVGPEAVALVTGEEKVKPPRPRYWIATVEAMPRDIDVAFCAIDEIQLGADFGRGHVFTDRLLNMRGRAETLVIGSATIRPLVERLLPGANIVSRPRLSTLSFAGEKKVTRLPPRSAIVAFSVEEVYAVAELIRRQKGGAAVVLGALSPRTRNAQVELFQSGDVDYLVATDAIGMGLNLDLDHVAFAGDRKFDGFGYRRLTPAEFGQIAGRAGRHMRDGTFGTTGRCPPFEPELVQALEDHGFDPLRQLQWRNASLDMRSIRALQASLSVVPREEGLTRAPVADDVAVLEQLAADAEVRDYAKRPAEVMRLWDVCQVPDYRKVSPHAHADLVGTLFRALMREGAIADTWFARQIDQVDRTDGDIDALSARIAQVRTWTYVANRPDWLIDPEHWQGRARQVEDRLSDALHERLASRFVDRRTSVLMRRLRENAHMEAEVTPAGDVSVEGQHIGHLSGFQFAPDPEASGSEMKALRAAAQKALASEIEARAERLAAAADEALVLSNDGTIRWLGDAVAKLAAGEKLLAPRFILIADEQLTGAAHDKVQARLELWLKAHVAKLLGPLFALEEAADLTGLARGIAFQVVEALGVLERSRVVQDVKALDQAGRAQLRKHGLRFGAYHIYAPQLLKPAPRALSVQLWALKHGGPVAKGVDDLPHLAASGRTSIPVDPEIDRQLYRAAGFRVCGNRAVRVDMLERLADLIRPAVTYRPGVTPGDPPSGAADGDGFVVTVSMTSLVGCSGEDFGSILRSLGYVADRRRGPAITVPLVPKAAVTPAAAPQAPPASDTEGETEPEVDGGVETLAGTATDDTLPSGTTAADGFDAGATVAPETPAEVSEVAEAAAAAMAEAFVETTEAADGADEVAKAAVIEEIAAAAADEPVAEVTIIAAPTPAPAGDSDLTALDADAGEAADAGGVAPDAVAAEAASADPVPAAETAEAEATDGEPVADAETAAAAPPAEPDEIEVWRPHRHQNQRQNRGRYDGARPQGRGFRRDGAGQGEPRRSGQSHDGQGPAGPNQGGQSQGNQHADNRADGPRSGAGRPGRGRGGQRPEHGRDQRPERTAEAGGGEPRDGRPGRGGRHDGGRGDRRPDFRSDNRGDRRGSGPKPDKAPDPNSPFAKLLILKERMESGER
ncbi:helicase-related protein [Chelatococcus reniformis]|uniref:Helicase n=1 Tax=Chelatococcus reniformis TaxID=1494448 RepID=A0A916X750_9HYPH|nr:helicase-related protein [Chelatococcus reniformis]GGC50488.1 hypothetical protein GCM10010994_07060 [Chelatococcus reniformis]